MKTPEHFKQQLQRVARRCSVNALNAANIEGTVGVSVLPLIGERAAFQIKIAEVGRKVSFETVDLYSKEQLVTEILTDEINKLIEQQEENKQ